LSWRDGQALAKKSVYSQNLSAVLALDKTPYCFSLSKEWLTEDWSPGQGWPGDPGNDRKIWEIRETISGAAPTGLLERRECPREAGWDLSKAERLIVAGFGVGNAEGVKLAAEVAEALSAEWGVSRPVAMNAWAPLERLVGVSGAMAAPGWAACFGASGAAALLSGISGAKRIASINIDPEAPIMAGSDLAIVGDAKAILAELKKLLEG
jgi:electron transfer flavoprotein alpha subunit